MQPDYSMAAAYRTIDRYGEGTIHTANLQEFLRSYGTYLVDQEVFAAIRRVDTNGDARISFDEFADFFKNQVNMEAALLQGTDKYHKSNGSRVGPVAATCTSHVHGFGPRLGHRGYNFATNSTLGANMVSPVQRNPVPGRSTHNTSPLRGPKSQSYAASAGGHRRNQSCGASAGMGSRINRALDASMVGNSPRARALEKATPYASASKRARESARQARTNTQRFASPMKEETEHGVVNMLTQLGKINEDVERAKTNLCAQPDFNTFDCYRMFDIDARGNVSAQEIAYCLGDLGFRADVEEVRLWVQRFDSTGDGCLTFAEFARALTPKDAYFATMLARRPPTHRPINPYRKSETFSQATVSTFLDLMRAFMSSEGTTEATRQHLSQNPYFDTREAFRQCDLSGNGQVTCDEIRFLLENKGLRVSAQEAKAIEKQLDANGDGIITDLDFERSLRPRSPVKRI